MHSKNAQRIRTVTKIEVDDLRLDCYRALGVEINAIVDWLNPADPIFRRNRHQVLDSFPIAIPTLAALGGRDARRCISELEVAIDRGSALIEAASRILETSKSAARYLTRLSPTEMGPAWLREPVQLLFAALLAFAGKRPRTRSDWVTCHDYWRLSGLSEDQRYAKIDDSGRSRNFLGEYVFRELCQNGYSKSAARRLQRMTDGLPDRVLYIRGYCDFVSEWCAFRWTETNWTNGPTRAERLLMRYPLAELLSQSIRWHNELFCKSSLRKIDIDKCPNMDVDSWRPILQAPVEHNGLRAISLVSFADLFQEDASLRHGVRCYADRCAVGANHLVSIRKVSGERLSTADLVLHQGQDGLLQASARHHHALANSTPNTECVQFLERVLDQVNSSENQKWLQEFPRSYDEPAKAIEALSSDDLDRYARILEKVLRRVVPEFDVAVAWIEQDCSWQASLDVL